MRSDKEFLSQYLKNPLTLLQDYKSSSLSRLRRQYQPACRRDEAYYVYCVNICFEIGEDGMIGGACDSLA